MMKNILRKKKGFTLVEVLIVIAIVGMLSTLAVNGYSEYRKGAVLNLSADNLIALFDQAKSKTLHGDGGAERYDLIKAELDAGGGVDADAADAALPEGNAKCFGLYFVANGEVYDLFAFEQAFVGKKVWINGAWQYQGCGEFDVSGEMEKVVWDEDVKIVSVSYNNDVSLDDFVLRFAPPDAAITDFANFNSVKIGLRYLNDSDYQKTVNFDFKNKNASKEND